MITVRTAAGAAEQRQLELAQLTPADLDSDFLRALGLTRQQPALPPIVANVIPGGAAERAGLKREMKSPRSTTGRFARGKTSSRRSVASGRAHHD